MITVDTNLLVRYVTNDDPNQAQQALAVLASGEAIFLPKTVILELEWVLRAAYRLPPRAIERALLTVLGLPGIVPENPQQLVQALEGYRQGIDFADALHYASGEKIRALQTFDLKFIKRGTALGWNVHPVPDIRNG